MWAMWAGLAGRGTWRSSSRDTEDSGRSRSRRDTDSSSSRTRGTPTTHATIWTERSSAEKGKFPTVCDLPERYLICVKIYINLFLFFRDVNVSRNWILQDFNFLILWKKYCAMLILRKSIFFFPMRCDFPKFDLIVYFFTDVLNFRGRNVGWEFDFIIYICLFLFPGSAWRWPASAATVVTTGTASTAVPRAGTTAEAVAAASARESRPDGRPTTALSSRTCPPRPPGRYESLGKKIFCEN